MLRPLGKILLIIAGFFCLALGVIGIFVPLLPTTPFLLLAAFCFLRSSRKLYDWLLNHRLFGPVVRNYLINRAVSLKTKIGAMVLLAGSLVLSMVLIARLPVTIALTVVGLAVGTHILTLKTLKSGAESGVCPAPSDKNGPEQKE